MLKFLNLTALLVAGWLVSVNAFEEVLWEFERDSSNKPGTVTIQAGDCLTFKTTTGRFHNVIEFASKDSYKDCDFSGGVELQMARVEWEEYDHCPEEGVHYFGCSIGPHCTIGNMKVKVVVTNDPDSNHYLRSGLEDWP